MATQSKRSKEERQLLRDYNARKALHARQIARRRRDNWVIALAAVVILTLVGVAQFAYFAWGPGVPAPEPTAAETDSPDSAEPTGDASTESSDEEPAPGASIGVPSPELAEGRTWTGTLTLNDIPLEIELDGQAAPQAVATWIENAANGYYIGKTCHRLGDMDGFQLIQCGSTDGVGGDIDDYRFGPVENAPADGIYPAGTIAMARQAENAYSHGHQFFLVTGETTLPEDSAGGYTVVGRITSGLDRLIAEIISAGVDEATMGFDGTGQPKVPTTITGLTIQ